jgi:hypothetical protein
MEVAYQYLGISPVKTLILYILKISPLPPREWYAAIGPQKTLRLLSKVLSPRVLLRRKHRLSGHRRDARRSVEECHQQSGLLPGYMKFREQKGYLCDRRPDRTQLFLRTILRNY